MTDYLNVFIFLMFQWAFACINNNDNRVNNVIMFHVGCAAMRVKKIVARTANNL